MKANEAPEKIYIHPSVKDGEYNRHWLIQKVNQNSVEYVRTDAFIDKAVNFLEMLGYGFTITDNITHENYDKEQLIADFRNYIK